MSLELDVTKPVGDFSITTPDGKIVYDVYAITKEPMALFSQMSEVDTASADPREMALQMIVTLSSVLRPQNGGPPARELFERLFDEGFLGIQHLRQIGEYIQDTAVGSPPV